MIYFSLLLSFFQKMSWLINLSRISQSPRVLKTNIKWGKLSVWLKALPLDTMVMSFGTIHFIFLKEEGKYLKRRWEKLQWKDVASNETGQNFELNMFCFCVCFFSFDALLSWLCYFGVFEEEDPEWLLCPIPRDFPLVIDWRYSCEFIAISVAHLCSLWVLCSQYLIQSRHLVFVALMWNKPPSFLLALYCLLGNT